MDGGRGEGVADKVECTGERKRGRKFREPQRWKKKYPSPTEVLNKMRSGESASARRAAFRPQDSRRPRPPVLPISRSPLRGDGGCRGVRHWRHRRATLPRCRQKEKEKSGIERSEGARERRPVTSARLCHSPDCLARRQHKVSLATSAARATA